MLRLTTATAMLFLIAGCRLLIGDFDECLVDADCSSVGSRLVCSPQRLCIKRTFPSLDARCVSIGLGGADGGTVVEEAIRIGALLGRTRTTGMENATGIARQHALELAVEQLNPPIRQGIRGRFIELIACDTKSVATTASELANHLVAQGVSAIITSGSAETIAVASVAVPAGVLVMSMSATAPEITYLADTAPDAGLDAPGLVWRTAPPDTLQASVIASELVDAGTPKLAVLQVNDPYGQGLVGALGARYPTEKFQAIPYAQNSKPAEIQAAINSVVNYGPQSLLIIAFLEDAVNLVNEAVTRPSLLGRPMFFTDSAKSPALFTGLMPDTALEGAKGTAAALAEASTPASLWFTTQYTQRYGVSPRSLSATANAFDAMMCLALAAYSAKVRPDDTLTGTMLAFGLARLYAPGATKLALIPTAFNAAALELDKGNPIDVEGTSGPLDFDDASGEAAGPIELWQIQGKEFKTLRTVVP
jgi:branched-chain amino acid transport system substrate-binding protein